MKLRAEVEAALSEAAHILQDDLCTNVHCLSCRTPLLALVELGVRLGIEAAKSQAIQRVKSGKPSSEGTAVTRGGAEFLWYWRELDALVPADILQAQLGQLGLITATDLGENYDGSEQDWKPKAWPGAEEATTAEGHVCGFNGFDGRKDRCARCEELREYAR